MALPSPPHAVKILHQTLQVSPGPGSVPTTSLPLTFFDLLWHLCCPVQRLYFYELPNLTHHYFFETIVPTLERSLSLTLQHFFPFAGNLVCPPSPAKPHILFSAGDSVPLTVAESAAGDFEALTLTMNQPRDVRELHLFVPDLPPARVDAPSGTRVVPLMALQVTLFPNSGFSIGVSFCHVAADGRAFHHFMKSWASICKAKGSSDLGLLKESPPNHDRDLTMVPTELEHNLLKDFWMWAATTKKYVGPINDGLAGKVRATFIIGQAQIERVKDWATNQCDVGHISTFVVTCALLWVCLIKSEEIENGTGSNVLSDKDEPYFFVFAADCRGRFENPIPKTYFGNCLAFCMVSVKRKELLGANGIVAAVKAIGKKIKELESGVLEGADKWMQDWKEILEKHHFVTVAGSPKLGVYETDFGWGRPKRSELVHTDVSGAISLSDRSDDKHGVEVSLSLCRSKMSHFNAILEESLRMVLF